MSGRKRKNPRNIQSVDVNTLLTNAISEGNLTTVQELVRSYDLSHCEEWHGGYVPLCKAITSGRTKIATFLLQEGAEKNCGTDRTNTPLHYAVELRCVGLELVRLLLEKTAQIDAQNGQNLTPLHLAAKEGYVETVQVLLDSKASVTTQTNEGLTPLFFAIEGRHAEVVKMLLEYAYANIKTSRRNGNLTLLTRVLLCSPSICDKVNKLIVDIITDESDVSKIVDDLVSYGFSLSSQLVSESLLFTAVKKNLSRLIESIVRNGASHNSLKYRPLLLHTAVQNGCCEIVKLFLDSKLDVNAKDEEGKVSIFYSLNCREESSCLEIIQQLLASGAQVKDAPELLHIAVNEGFIGVCKILVQNKADVNAVNSNGETPLHIICQKKKSSVTHYGKQKDSEKINESTRHEIIKLLLNSNADASIKAEDGLTAFHHAVKNGWKETVRIFLDHGVIVDLRAKDGATPLYFAAERGLKDIVEILCENDANVDAPQKNGSSPLHRAVYGENATGESSLFPYFWRDIVSLLLDYGCNINAETFGGTALNLAISGVRSEYAKNRREICHDFYNEHAYDRRLSNPEEFDEYMCRSSTDEDDYIDEEFDPDDYYTVKTLKKHAIKMQVAGMFVSEKNLHLLKDSQSSYFDFKKKCEEEVVRMKNANLQPGFFLYDILTNSKNIAHVKSKMMMDILKDFDCKAYPVYGSLIVNKFKRSKCKVELLSAGQKSLDILIKTSTKLSGKKLSLPDELLIQIVSYLKNSDIRSMIHCGKSLKPVHCKSSEKEEKNVRGVKKVDVNKSIISAVSEGSLADVKDLVQSYGLCHSEEWCRGYVLLCNAIQAGRIEIAKFLLKEGAEANQKTDRVNTLLHCALVLKPVDLEFVHLLLEKNAPIDAQNDESETPLHIAAKGGNVEIIQALLSKNASVITQTSEGFTPLFLAVEGEHEEVVRIILKHACGNNANYMPLVFPVEKRNSILLNHILLYDHDICAKVNELIVRFVTRGYGHRKIVDYLADYGFVLGREYVNEPLLHTVTVKSYAKLMRNILMNDANSSAKYSSFLLHTAVKNGHKEMIEVFLNAGFDVNAKDEAGKTSLCHSLNSNDEGKSVEILRLLFASGADIKAAPELLHKAVFEGCFEVCKVLVENGANINTLNTNGMAPLHLAVPSKVGEFGFAYRKQKRKIEETTRDEIVQLLMSNGGDISVKASDGFTAFHHAAKNGREEAVCVFLNFGADVNLRAEDDSTLLHSASVKGRKDIVQILCMKKANVEACDKNGSTPLHLACKEAHEDIVEILCRHGANVEACDKNGSTPLHLACKEAHEDIVEILCRRGANVNACQNDGLTPLHLASEKGEVKIVKILCKKNANVNARQKNGRTPLHTAATAPGQYSSVIQTLLEFGADIDARGPKNKTALHFAAFRVPECDDAIKILLNNGCDINAETKFGSTALEIANSEAESYHKEQQEEQRRDRRMADLPDELHGYSYDDIFDDDDDDYFDIDVFNPNEYQMIKTLLKHSIKLEVAGLYVSEKNLNLRDESCLVTTDYEQKCQEEVERLKKTKSNRQFTLFDVLVNCESFSRANKMSLLCFFKSFNFRRFPIYANLISSNVEKSVARLDLVDPARKALNTLIKTSSKSNGKCSTLPAKPLKILLSYLSNSDLKGLIYCSETREN